MMLNRDSLETFFFLFDLKTQLELTLLETLFEVSSSWNSKKEITILMRKVDLWCNFWNEWKNSQINFKIKIILVQNIVFFILRESNRFSLNFSIYYRINHLFCHVRKSIIILWMIKLCQVQLYIFPSLYSYSKQNIIPRVGTYNQYYLLLLLPRIHKYVVFYFVRM